MAPLELIAEKVSYLGGELFVSFNWADNFYLTQVKTSFGVTLVGPKGFYFFTDGRYFEKVKKEIRKEFKVKKWNGLDDFKEFLKGLKLKGLVLDPERLKGSTLLALTESFEVITSNNFLKEFREVKSPREISLIAQSALISQLALKKVLHLLKPGITELEFRKELIRAFFELGGEGEAFPTIVASGKGSAIPHWQSSNKEIREGEAVIVDFGTTYRGYVSDITRTFLIGKVPRELKEIYQVVKEAQELGKSSLKAGKGCREVDNLVRNYIAQKGYGDLFVHSLGHGIGVEVHESPSLSPKSKEVLREGNVVTVEPGIYVPELGGVRTEDDCVVTQDGAFSLCQEI